MKIGIITDTHFGVRNDNPVITKNTEKFLSNVFFPEIDRRQIKTVVHLGDLVDRRKYINFQTANRMRLSFIDPMINRDLNYIHLMGNHDVYHKNTNELNALHELYGYNKFQIINEAKEVDLGETKVLLIPWICPENRSHTFDWIRNTRAQVAFGHLDLIGPEEIAGHFSNHGDDPENFKKFEIVLSGHFHHRSVYNNIHYLGSHAQFSWGDYGEVRGFHIFDTQTRELEFIKNPVNTFKKYYYDDSIEQTEVNFEEFRDCYVKVIVIKKNNAYFFENFIDKMEQYVIDCKITENILFDTADSDQIINESESTLDIFKNYIQQIETDIDKEKVSSVIHQLYNEALTLGIE